MELSTHITYRFRRLRARAADESGVAMIEFGIVVPVLLMVVIGILFFGRFMNYAIDQTHLANEGARWAAVNGYPGCPSTSAAPCNPSLQQFIASQVDSGELRSGSTDVTDSTGNTPQGAQVCIAFPSSTGAGGTPQLGDPVTVKVKAYFHFLPFLGFLNGGGALPVTETSTMRIEAPPTTYAADSSC